MRVRVEKMDVLGWNKSVEYFIFYQGETIDHGRHFPGPVAKSSA